MKMEISQCKCLVFKKKKVRNCQIRLMPLIWSKESKNSIINTEIKSQEDFFKKNILR